MGCAWPTSATSARPRCARSSAQAIGDVDLLIVPVGDGPTVSGEQAARIVEELSPRWVVPMHYRTPKVGFLETEEAFVERMPRSERLDAPSLDTGGLPEAEGPLALVPRGAVGAPERLSAAQARS